MTTSGFRRSVGGWNLVFEFHLKRGGEKGELGACGRFYPSRSSVARKIVIHTSCQLNNPPPTKSTTPITCAWSSNTCRGKNPVRAQGIYRPRSHSKPSQAVSRVRTLVLGLKKPHSCTGFEKKKIFQRNWFLSSWRGFCFDLSSRESCGSLKVG